MGKEKGKGLSEGRQKLDCSRNAQVWTDTQAWRYSKPIICYSVTLASPLQTWDQIQFQHQRRVLPWPSQQHSHPRWVGVSPQGGDGAFYSTSLNLKKHLAPDPGLIFFPPWKALLPPLLRICPVNGNTTFVEYATVKKNNHPNVKFSGGCRRAPFWNLCGGMGYGFLMFVV